MHKPLRVSLSVPLLTLAALTSLAGAAATSFTAEAAGDGRQTRIIAEVYDEGVVKLTAMGSGRSKAQIVQALKELASQFDADIVYLQGRKDSASVLALQQVVEAAGLTTQMRMAPVQMSQTLPATFQVHLDEPDTVRVRVFDIHGTLVKMVHEYLLPAGDHKLTWTKEDFSPEPGIYFARIQAKDWNQMWKILVR